MQCLIKNTDVLDEPSDALIYSTNILSNCTGGVGACLVAKYGRRVQIDLHRLLSNTGKRFASQGTYYQHVSPGMPYQAVFHCVPSDGWYDTTPLIVETLLRQCLDECVKLEGIYSITTSALATGYGHLHFEDYLRLASHAFNDPKYAVIRRATICVADDYAFRQALELIKAESLSIASPRLSA